MMVKTFTVGLYDKEAWWRSFAVKALMHQHCCINYNSNDYHLTSLF